jgi:uncharacterized surface protein with fasciclin (FAS1) repeats
MPTNTLESTAKLQRWREALKTTGLEQTLKGEGPFTIFAPTDDAFDRLPDDLRQTLLADKTKFKRIIAYHIGFGDVRSDDLRQIDEVMTVEGSVIGVEKSGDTVKLNNATVIATDILEDNTVIHVIDTILFPALVVVE